MLSVVSDDSVMIGRVVGVQICTSIVYTMGGNNWVVNRHVRSSVPFEGT